jgi:hypothetical protein
MKIVTIVPLPAAARFCRHHPLMTMEEFRLPQHSALTTLVLANSVCTSAYCENSRYVMHALLTRNSKRFFVESVFKIYFFGAPQ